MGNGTPPQSRFEQLSDREVEQYHKPYKDHVEPGRPWTSMTSILNGVEGDSVYPNNVSEFGLGPTLWFDC